MTDIAPIEARLVVPVVEFDRGKVELIKRTICDGATNDELELFLAQCRRTGLDPFARQIYSISRWDAAAGAAKRTTQVSIDGMRLVAERTGRYRGQLGPLWCGADGVWVEVWLAEDPPAAAKVGICHRDFPEPLWSTVTHREFAQTRKDGHPTAMWARMPAHMLAKCAESNGLRKAFPHELSGLHTAEEMSQTGPDLAPKDMVDQIFTASAALTPAQKQDLRERCEAEGLTIPGPGAHPQTIEAERILDLVEQVGHIEAAVWDGDPTGAAGEAT
jgi:phage recombination protein Bet